MRDKEFGRLAEKPCEPALARVPPHSESKLIKLGDRNTGVRHNLGPSDRYKYNSTSRRIKHEPEYD